MSENDAKISFVTWDTNKCFEQTDLQNFWYFSKVGGFFFFFFLFLRQGKEIVARHSSLINLILNAICNSLEEITAITWGGWIFTLWSTSAVKFSLLRSLAFVCVVLGFFFFFSYLLVVLPFLKYCFSKQRAEKYLGQPEPWILQRDTSVERWLSVRLTWIN